MICERIYLDEKTRDVYLDTYAAEYTKIPPVDGILVLPGGGYGHLCSDREGESVALAFAARGINAFVLHYRVGEGHIYPEQLLDAARAMAYIRENAAKYSVNPSRIYAVGFSAGGHLCATLATKHKLAERMLSLPENAARPEVAVLSYPVITAYAPTHQGSFVNLLGKPFDSLSDEERALHSAELHVDEDTPPMFIWHTAEDRSVPINGTLKMLQACYDAGVKVEGHIYPYGPHGIALGIHATSAMEPKYIQPKAEPWVDECVAFIESLKS